MTSAKINFTRVDLEKSLAPKTIQKTVKKDSYNSERQILLLRKFYDGCVVEVLAK